MTNIAALWLGFCLGASAQMIYEMGGRQAIRKLFKE